MTRRLLLVMVALGVFTASARPLAVAIAPLPLRLAQARCVVIGQVTEIEKKTVQAVPAKGSSEKVEYQVAVIKVAETLKGDKGLTHVRIGFIPAPAPQPQPQPRIRPILPRRGFRAPSLKVGQEACFLLQPHHDQTFFVIADFQGVIAKGDNEAVFKKQMTEVRSLVKLADDPVKGLKSKDKQDQLLAAYLLVMRHRTPPRGARNPRLQPIDAEESKQILSVLRDADWNQRGGQANPFMVFNMLGVTAKDGFQRPRNFQQFPAAAKAWLTKHADTYRIQGYPGDDK